MFSHAARSRLLGGVLFSVLAVASAAFGLDTNHYTGAFCTFASADQYDGQARTPPKFHNASGNNRTVICPFMSDALTDVETASINGDAAIDEDTCKFMARSKDGTYLGFWSHDNVITMSAGINKTVWFSGGAFADTVAEDTYAISCTLPNGLAITSYGLAEK